MANEISVTRERLGDSSPWGSAGVPAAAEESRASGEIPAGRALPAGRARLREGPLGDLFRSTLRPDDGGEKDPHADSLRPDHAGARAPDPAAPRRPLSLLELVGASSREGSDAVATSDHPRQEGSWLEDRAMEVEPRRARMLANSEALLGPEHPDTLWAAHDLAFALGRVGEVVAAWRLAARLVEVRTRLQGVDHPHTVRAYELRAAVTERPERRPR